MGGSAAKLKTCYYTKGFSPAIVLYEAVSTNIKHFNKYLIIYYHAVNTEGDLRRYIIGFLFLPAVSYTHLDVYKRQILQWS